MNSENQNGIPKRRPVATSITQSPRISGKGPSLAKVAGSPAINGSPVLRDYSQHESNGIRDTYAEEDVATPVKAFLNSNITPRSGSRKARAGISSPNLHGTPNGTPISSRPGSSRGHHERPREDPRGASGLGLRISNVGKRSRTSSMVSDGPGSSVSSRSMPVGDGYAGARVSSPENGAKFFYANDVKSTPSVSEQHVPQPRLPGHIQNNEESGFSDRLSSTSNKTAADEPKPKLFHASAHKEPKPITPSHGNGSLSNRPPLQTIYSAHDPGSPPRASSPLKEQMLPRKPSITKASPRRHTRLVSNGGTELKSPETIPHSNGTPSRRSSLNSPRQVRYSSHARSSSVQSAGPKPHRRSSIAMSDTSPTEQTKTVSLVGTNGTFPHSVNPPAITQEVPKSPVRSQPQSPTKPTFPGQSNIDQMNELAANARRERKVLDLEISNSSLLAINRTLEREMRKQSAELRRYRRLGRSGRVSVAAPSRSVSGRMSMLSEIDTTMDSDDLVSSDDENDPDLSSDPSSPTTASHPSSPTQRAARARFRDPKHVELDLAAHRALLADSHKLNLSIKRCLSQSEGLISSAKRALEYEAPVPKSDDLGTRVLTPDENEDETFSHGQGLLSPSLAHTSTNPWERSLSNDELYDGGLETPDYSKWGPPTEAQTPFTEGAKPFEEPTLDDGGRDATEQAFKDAVPKTDIISPVPQDEERRTSLIPSLDGLDDEPGDGPALSSDDDDIFQTDNKEGNRDSDAAMKPPDPQPGQPGYRGSMQGLGHYLQAFSIFGTPQKT